MVETANLKGIAWDLFSEGGRHYIRRLPFILDATGREIMENDIFACDQAVIEFVEVMAERGNYDCEAALLMARKVNDGNYLDNVSPLRTAVQQEDRA